MLKKLKRKIIPPNFLPNLLKKAVGRRKTLARLAYSYLKFYEATETPDFNSGHFEHNGEEEVLKRLSSFDLKMIFDGGANVGYWTLMARCYFKHAHIHSFEISRRTFDYFKNNIQTNFGEEFNNYTLSYPFLSKQKLMEFTKQFDRTNCFAHNVGLADKNGEIDYYDFGTNACVNSILKTELYGIGQKLSALAIRGDEFCKQHKISSIDFLKLDVEGAEPQALKGFGEFLADKIRIIQFEHVYAESQFVMKDFYRLLSDYAIGKITPKGVLFCDNHKEIVKIAEGNDYLAVLKNETDIIKKLNV